MIWNKPSATVLGTGKVQAAIARSAWFAWHSTRSTTRSDSSSSSSSGSNSTSCSCRRNGL